MNNDAFQKLVRERATEKSSKEIAREAVEQEFRQHKRKRKRRRGAGGSSDEDDDDDDSDVDDDHKQKDDETETEGAVNSSSKKEQSKGREERKAVSSTAIEPGTAEGDNLLSRLSTSLAGVAAAAETGRRHWKLYPNFSGGMKPIRIWSRDWM
jgi:hypothetical protein